MAIDDNIKEVAATIHAERLAKQVNPDAPTPVTIEVQTKAINAILGTIADYVDYMKIFAKTDTELARLIPTDGSKDPARQLARAYLVCNGMCASGTGDKLLNRVSIAFN